MVSAVRRRMQDGVNVTRGLRGAIIGRVVPESAVIAQCAAVRDRAADLATDVVVPAADDIARIQSRIRGVIASLTTDELAVDATAVEAIRNLVTRQILQQQVGEIALLHLVDAVFGGVEQGLRDLVRSHGARKSGLDPSPSPSPGSTLPQEDPKTRAPPPPPPRELPASPARTSPRATGGDIPTPQDTPDI